MHNKTIAYLFLFFFSIAASGAMYGAEGTGDISAEVRSLEDLAFEVVMRTGKDLTVVPYYKRGSEEPLYRISKDLRDKLVEKRRLLQDGLEDVINGVSTRGINLKTKESLLSFLMKGAVFTKGMKQILQGTKANFLGSIINDERRNRANKSKMLLLMAELLQRGFNPNAKVAYNKKIHNYRHDRVSGTLLNFACDSRCPQSVTLLLKAGAEVRTEHVDPLKEQLEKPRNFDIIKAFLLAKKEVNRILFWAAENGHSEIVNLSLESGGDPGYVKDSGQNSVVESAIVKARNTSTSCSVLTQKRHWLTVKKMLKKCDRETVLRAPYANALLYGAARFGDVDLTKLAHSFGATWSLDYLDIAFLHAHHDIMRSAAKKQPTLFEQVFAQDKFDLARCMAPFVPQEMKNNVLYASASSGSAAMVKVLLDHDASGEIKFDGQTAREAAQGNKMAELFLSDIAEKFTDLSQQESQGLADDLFRDESSVDQQNPFCVHRTTIGQQLGHQLATTEVRG